MKPEDLGTYYESILDKEVRKEGGIYYTPPLIVEYMVANSLGELLKGKTPNEAAKIKIVDPACGGGVFLLGAYQFLLDWHEKHFGKLTLAQRRKILNDNIFGVDIDPLAVEITKYGLSMICSEGKDFTTNLDQNICCGNSLVGFDWQSEFPKIFKQGGFDIVIGNPPWGGKMF
jgi:type I restriction-modification system DNA methylase subunit